MATHFVEGRRQVMVYTEVCRPVFEWDESVRAALTPIEFTSLTVDVSVMRETVALVESWRAESVASGATAGRVWRAGRSESDPAVAA